MSKWETGWFFALAFVTFDPPWKLWSPETVIQSQMTGLFWGSSHRLIRKAEKTIRWQHHSLRLTSQDEIRSRQSKAKLSNIISFSSDVDLSLTSTMNIWGGRTIKRTGGGCTVRGCQWSSWIWSHCLVLFGLALWFVCVLCQIHVNRMYRMNI